MGAEDEGKSEDGGARDDAVEDGDGDLFGEEGGNDVSHFANDDASFGDGAGVGIFDGFEVGGVFGFVVGAEIVPERVDEAGAVKEKEERKDEGDGGFAEDAADGGEARNDAGAKAGEKVFGEIFDGADDLGGKVVDAEGFSEVADGGEVGLFDGVRKGGDEFGEFVDDDRGDGGDDGGDDEEDDDVGEDGGEAGLGLFADEFVDFERERADGDGEKDGDGDDEEGVASADDEVTGQCEAN